VLLLSPPPPAARVLSQSLWATRLAGQTVTLDIGNLLGSLVGQSESNVRAALRLADAMAPCVLFCDELEKAFAGSGSSGQIDSGVTARVFGSLLTWLSDHHSDLFFIGTSNDISKLPPEFARAERFDGTFFIDLPAHDQREAIWEIPGKKIATRFLVLTKTKEPQIEEHTREVERGNLKRTLAGVERVWRAISAGNFYPAPSVVSCSSCGCQAACRAWVV
jgi:SpoVK/Ycf46/Vps4 family AAA+-type ATPase